MTRSIPSVFSFLFSTLFCASLAHAQAPAAKDIADAQRLYYQANAGTSAQPLRTALEGTKGFLGDGTFQAGALRTFDGRRRPIPGLRYHVGQHVLEAQDSLNTKLTHLWPVGSLRGFDIGEEEATPRRYRPRLVRDGGVSGTRREYVEVLTTLDGGPLVLGWVYSPAPAEAIGAYAPLQTLVAGPGYAGSEALRPLELTQAAVSRLFGKRADQVRTFATSENLHYDQPADVARLVDYFNRVAVAKW